MCSLSETAADLSLQGRDGPFVSIFNTKTDNREIVRAHISLTIAHPWHDVMALSYSA